jgi:hypothetical protein
VDWEVAKAAVEEWSGLHRDALHIYAALLIQLCSALVLRRTLASPWPWLVVLAFALGNEWLDVYRDRVVEGWEKAGAIHDLWNTMLAPTVLLLAVRFAPRLTTTRVRPPPPSD